MLIYFACKDTELLDIPPFDDEGDNSLGADIEGGYPDRLYVSLRFSQHFVHPLLSTVVFIHRPHYGDPHVIHTEHAELLLAHDFRLSSRYTKTAKFVSPIAFDTI